MNKKLNTVLFLFGATFVNILITVAALILLLVLYSRFLVSSLPESAQAWSLPILFIAAITVSFVAYRFLLKMLMKKIDIDKYFDPLFSGKRKK